MGGEGQPVTANDTQLLSQDARAAVTAANIPRHFADGFVAWPKASGSKPNALLNVLHRENAGLSEDLAKGLAVFLNSTAIDAYFRQFSGHTQVNAGDLQRSANRTAFRAARARVAGQLVEQLLSAGRR